jgi:hypothetical protein
MYENRKAEPAETIANYGMCQVLLLNVRHVSSRKLKLLQYNLKTFPCLLNYINIIVM